MARLPARDITLVQLLPNAMTLGAMCAGVTAMRLAMAGRFEAATLLVLFAALLDGLDGRVARVLNSESPIGAELDSLADVTNFGVAPAIILYFFALGQEPATGWAVALAYVVCCALRLARFNVGAKAPAAGDARFFTGVPAPAGAFLALAPIFHALALPGQSLPAWLIATWLAACGLLMISRLPTLSLKMRIPRNYARPVIGVLGLGAALMIVAPWATLLGTAALYLATLPVTVYLTRNPRKD